ncbi:fumarylacetoacetate hydrolase family protein [Novosphingobium terrae]|uniref:fumarylacetoacetate hydrolase family protein n=1 Tax=Novosphingobium terrae TaxID=2726189 RepID=UPI00197D75CC|nr:fumarylacetoacetate hydrolase family protein [Novosphingobium terrae]
MKIVKIARAGQSAEGFLEGERVHLVGGWHDAAPEDAPFTLTRHAEAAWPALRQASTQSVALDEVSLAVPLDPGARLLCVGMNYRDHLGEIKRDEAENPVIFTRFAETLSAHGEPIQRPRASQHFDFEGEIAVVIGKGGRHIPLETALDHVSGYTCFMDGSLRDYQRHSLTAGKNFHRSGAMGPWIVAASAMGQGDITLRTRLNDAQVQSSHSGLMIFGIAESIAYISRWIALRPGDVIATGTPGGVGSRREPPLWMKPGDRIEVEVGGVGVLANPVVDEA